MNRKTLITGATGNVGEALIYALFEHATSHTIIAGVRNIERSKQLSSKFDKLQFRSFDFEDPQTFDSAFEDIDTLFLLRPPHIEDVERYFRPLIERAASKHIDRIVFLSVQGADKMSFIPHAKIEKMIVASGIDYSFVRPSYFMQNLTTTLKSDLDAGCIVLPAGKTLFNWVDVLDIGRATASIIDQFELYKNQGLDITGAENLSFAQVVEIINSTCGCNVKYKSVNLLSFYGHKKRQGVPRAMILVMIMLHYLPRFKRPPCISDNYSHLTNRHPTSIKEFALRNLRLT